jgi:SEC-C motif
MKRKRWWANSSYQGSTPSTAIVAAQIRRAVLQTHGGRRRDSTLRLVRDNAAIAAAVLKGIILDEELYYHSAPGGGFAPKDATLLLVELSPGEAMPFLLATVEELGEDAGEDDEYEMSLVYDGILDTLPTLGAPALESTLELYQRTASKYLRDRLAEAFADLGRLKGIHDSRVLKILLSRFGAGDPDIESTAGDLGYYGDSGAMPAISSKLDHLIATSPTAGSSLQACARAVRRLGGTLTPTQEAALSWRWWTPENQEELEEMATSHRSRAICAATGTIQAADTTEPPRNGPCWCGSGKKYKRCHRQQASDPPNSGPVS